MENNHKKNILFTILLLFSLAIIFNWKTVLQGKVFYNDDLMHDWFEFKTYMMNAFLSGEGKLWNPYLLGGQPMVPLIHNLYNPSLLLLFLGPIMIVHNWILIIHCFIASLGTYMFLRKMKFSKSASIIGSIIFIYNGATYMENIHQTYVQTMAWLPFIFYLFELFLEKKKLIWATLIGLLYSLQILIGHPQIVYAILLFTFSYYIFRGFKILKNEGLKDNSKLIAKFCLGLIIGTSIASIQLLPTFEILPFAYRGQGHTTSYEFISQYSMSRSGLLWAFFHHLPGTEFTDGPIPASNLASGISIGLIGLTLAIMILVLKRDKFIWFFGIWTILSIFIMLGKYSPIPLGKLFLNYLPGFKLFRCPFRYNFIYVFCLSFFVAKGIEFLKNLNNNYPRNEEKKYWETKKQQTRFFFYCFLGFLIIISFLPLFWAETNKLAITYKVMLPSLILCPLTIGGILLYLKQKLSWKKLAIITTVAIFSEILLTITTWKVGVKAGSAKIFDFEEEKPFLEFLQKNAGYDRVYFMNQGIPLMDKREYFQDNSFEYFPENLCMVYKIPNVGGYHFPYSLNRYRKFINPMSYPFLNLFNTKYFITTETLPEPYFNLVFKYKIVSIYRNNYFLPKAFIAKEIEVLPNPESVLSRLRQPNFNYWEKILLEEEIPGEMKKPISTTEANINIPIYKPERIVLDTITKESGFMFLSEIFYTGWEATIDGQKTKIYQADYLFRSIYLPAGQHRVEFIYNPKPYKIGKWITVLSGIIIIVILLKEIIPILLKK